MRIRTKKPSTTTFNLVQSRLGPLEKLGKGVEQHSLAAQVETSDGVENVDDDEDKDDSVRKTHYLQHGKEIMSSGPAVRVVLIKRMRMHGCVSISKSCDVLYLAGGLDRRVRVHIHLMHGRINQDGAALSLSTARYSVRHDQEVIFVRERGDEFPSEHWQPLVVVVL